MIKLSFIFCAEMVLAIAFKTDLGPRPYALFGRKNNPTKPAHTHTPTAEHPLSHGQNALPF